ncbi:MAG: DNA mismatch repair protein MutS [Planctomycetota bacterium]|nr:DNA mismatch repair protein MutS [Planctomycetota bacterium]MDW8372085.1 DNA mismatch repair protein MutS [Planctomycetota bacterium]
MSKGGPAETPMLRQYQEARAAHPEALVLMRMGDFYEAFFDCAQELARVLGVALTSRNKDDPEPVPMAGIPHHSLPQHLPKLLAAGRPVAIVEQLEDPAQAKGLVRRGLTRLVTPGTLIDEQGLAATVANWLVALTGLSAPLGIAALDVSTGRFTVEEADDAHELAESLARLQPVELLLPASVRERPDCTATLAALLPTPPPVAALPDPLWDAADGRRFLCQALGVHTLSGFDIGDGDARLVSAAAAALRYAAGALRMGCEGGAASLGHIRSIQRMRRTRHLVLDAACRSQLELVRQARDGGRAGSLLAAIDRTCTAAGARMLAEWLASPLAEAAAIARRLDAVAWLVADDRRRGALRRALSESYDAERLLARIATGRANARDLVQLASTLAAAERVAALVAEGPALLAEAAATLRPCPELAADIARTLVDAPPPSLTDGGMVRDGVDAELDAARAWARDADRWLAAYQEREAQATGLRLKVGYNSVFGYYIELPRAAAARAPARFIRKQTLVNAERYITPELKEFEERALSAESRAKQRELQIFTELRQRADAAMPALAACAQALATVDVLAAFAELARNNEWCRPELVAEPVIELSASRHPVVEHALGRERFVPNDCCLDATAQRGPRLAVITGPNMAGKSTFIRQVALAVILAQAGSFVPARAARIGLCDRIFTRIGAGDELARQRSTFMVEMCETATILHHATARSLVVLDEVGRGTSTFDGLALAWAITEHLHDRVGCRTLFATHYHELTDLASDRPGIANWTVEVAAHDDAVVFLHRIVPGAARQSYGIQVAQLAGIPPAVIARAREVLESLERLNAELLEGERESARRRGATQLTLWHALAVEHPVVARLRALDLDAISPRQALAILEELQRGL